MNATLAVLLFLTCLVKLNVGALGGDTFQFVRDCPNDITFTALPEENGAAISWQPPVVVDSQNNLVAVVGSADPFKVFPVGTSTVTYTFSDDLGNSGSCSFDVTVQKICYNPLLDQELEFDITELCCNGKVFDNSDGEYVCSRAFADFTVYRRNDYQLCNNELMKKGGDQTCCNNEVVDTTVQECCDDRVFQKEDGWQCCGGHYIDTSVETCCRDNVVSSVGTCCGISKTFNPSEEMCIAGSVYSFPEHHDMSEYKLCESVDALYNPNTHMCCDEIIGMKINNIRCHGTLEYDVTNELIVRETAIGIENGRTVVCDTRTYNPNTEVCCDNEVYHVGSAEGACCEGRPYSRHNASCCWGVINEGIPEVPDIQMCSGTVSYLNSFSISCQYGIVQDRGSEDKECCGNEVINTKESICCGGNPLPRAGSDVCCGRQVLQQNQFCIEGDVVDKLPGEDSYCVLRSNTMPFLIERTITYNSSLYMCHRGALLLKRPNDEYCEGAGEVYNSQTEMCCANMRVHKKVNPWGLARSCCGHQVYHPQEQSCHHHTHSIFQIPEKFTNFCGLALFDVRSEVCIDGYVFSNTATELPMEVCNQLTGLSAFNQTCCEGKVINDDTHFCCGNQIYSKEGMTDPGCCGGRIFEPTEALCCESTLHFTHGEVKNCSGHVALSENEQLCGDTIYNLSDGVCCGNGIYDPEEELCCDSVRLPKDHENEDCCGTQKYRKNGRKICCQNTTLHVSAPGQDCCGSALFNPDVEVCLDDHFQLPSSQMTCNPSDSNQQLGTCCKGVLHVGKFGTCDGFNFVKSHQVSRQARSDQMYPPATCGDDLRYNPLTHTCCGGAVIENGLQICCQGKARKVTQENENSCCGIKAYNNDTAICCGKRVKMFENIQHAADARGCCEDGQYFDLERLQCQQECPLCRPASLPVSEVDRVARQAVNILNVRIMRAMPGEDVLRVKVTPLKNCFASISAKELRTIKTMSLPQGCDCQSPLVGKYVLLASGDLSGSNQLDLQMGDVLLSPKYVKVLKNICKS